MRTVTKVFFLALVSFLISFLPLDLLCSQKLIYAQSFEFSPDELGRDELMRWTCPERSRRIADGGPLTTASHFAEQNVVKASLSCQIP